MMFVSFLRRSRFLRALVLTVGIFAFLAWFYIILRIVFNHVDVGTPFIDHFPSISIWVLGTFSFVLSALCTFVYIWLWGRIPYAPIVLPAYERREP